MMWLSPSRLFFVCVLFLVGLLTDGATAQTATPATVDLNWQGYEQLPPAPGLSEKIPAFEGASFDYTEGLPYYQLRFEGNQLNSFQLQHAKYQPFSAEDQKLFKAKNIPAEPAVRISHGTENKHPVSTVAIMPVRRNPQSGQPEKLVSFSYTHTSGNSATGSGNMRVSSAAGASNSNKTSSVLNSGTWYKLGITTTGIYKIDKATLQALGINTQGLDPKTIQVYGNGGGMLPQANSTPRPDDLLENAIWVSGEADGRFDDNDFALFYGQGPHTWNYNANLNLFKHEYNLYTDTAYYFLRVGSTQGARISSRGQAAGAAQTISSYNERLFHERDIKNMVSSGREWYGEEFSSFTTTRDFAFNVSDIIPGSDIKLTSFLMANSPITCSFAVRLNGTVLGTQYIPGRGNYQYHPLGVNSTQTHTINQQALGQASELKVGLTFGTGGSTTSTGYLNYLELNLERQLKLYGDQTSFRSVQSLTTPASTFRIAGTPAGATVWDVTNPQQPVLQETTTAGSDLTFSAPTSLLREFVVFKGNTGFKPATLGLVNNQNLHALNLNGNIDFVILTHPAFLQEANRLAEYRSRKSNMEVTVVTTTQVYNEFASGAQDVTAIRDFMRMLYGRSHKSGSNVMYLLLFGDASYDYKNRISGNTNFVPIYESRESLNPLRTYSSEDYYGFLDDDEGEWQESSFGNHLLDIGIGRLPARTPAHAATLADKIMAYESPSHFGKWRNQITFIADDGDTNEHQNDAEFLAGYVEQDHKKFNNNKIYVDLYPQIAVANGQRSPEAITAINKAVEKGSLILNYTGHGNEVSLASEQLITIPQINNWRNSNNLTFMLTATCDFGRYDDPGRTSGAELSLLNDQGGTVGLLTTTRPVYAYSNRVLNRNFFWSALTPLNGKMPLLGDIMRLTKNNSLNDVNNRNFTLLGDPSLKLAYPELEARITKINGQAAATDTLSALGRVTITGQVQQANGSLASDFGGKMHLTVYDKQTTLTTFGDDTSYPVPIKLRESIVYDGQATVKNGMFEVSFVVPKDIAYNYGTGKISLYASNAGTDAHGASNTIIVGGSAKNVAADEVPPTIRLFMDDESFVFGGTTGKTATLLAKIADENGINTAGLGIGHEITAVLDEAKDNLIVLNDYYTADVDSYQSGTVKYSLQDLAPGPHSLRLKAWDTHNNSNEEYLEFYVSNDAGLALNHLLNHPNPFSTRTTFHFDHNRAGENLEVQVQIFTISGKLVKTLETTSYASKAHLAEITWDGRDEYNDILARGVYVYKVSVRSQQDGSKTSKFEKLVILN
ncbi:type IX secretion system sortase PorU [Botryobacter ruber]|uniref:type IX secretion system sortase PorU n=1 Tax=Botryobacter ruber TaxID=2171629 RepID=UPI001F0C9DBF|nr:type IX secretion system sortase PorU [Botryobacter ruber]